MTLLYTWRGEIATGLALVASWLIFTYVWKRPFWPTAAAGTVLGALIEYMSEPEWNYAMAFYIWRDISPFTVLGWGVLFAWQIALADTLYVRWFGCRPEKGAGVMLADFCVGAPLFVGGELLGIHVLKIWNYDPMLQWNHLIPGIQYPWEAIVAMVFFVAAFPSAIRYWEGMPARIQRALARAGSRP